jgi:hypothetical protein
MLYIIVLYKWSRSMSRPRYPSDNIDKMLVRFPQGLRERIKANAQSNRRSMNSEIVFHLERIFAPQAATGEGFADTAPAAVTSKTALAGGSHVNQGL